MNNKLSSPFTPGNPVPVEFFVGRKEQIDEIIRDVGEVLFGKQKNIFLVGDRGIGKSSLASFIRYYVNTQRDILGIHLFLGEVVTLDVMVHHIFEQILNEILKETKGQSWFKEISKFFGKYIKEIDIFNISISFAPPEQDLKELVRKFPEALNNLLLEIREQKKGLLIILDDINGLAEKLEFANWYKSFVDEIYTHYKNFPVLMILVGLPEKRDRLFKLQPSLMRIFKIIEIEKLFDEEVENFFKVAFQKVNMKIEPDAMKVMVQYSSGLPILMHEIGDATFWTDEDGIIDKDDAFEGIVAAATNVGKKYLDPMVYRAIRSPKYKSILRKLGKMHIPRTFKKKDVEAKLDANEKKVFHNFLKKLREIGVIEIPLENERGTYKFVNEIYPIYIWMESDLR
jgi:DNA replication protein DnaC